MKIYDISVPLCAQTPVWEGDKQVTIRWASRISEGAEYNLSELEMSTHAGTHLDAPFHVFADGAAVDQIALEKLIGKTQVIHIPDDVRRISREAIAQKDLVFGISRLLIRTANSNRWKAAGGVFRKDYVGLDSGAAGYLVERGYQLVGIDGFSISPTDDLIPPHRILLDGGVAILETLDLSGVPQGIYDLYCLPLKLIGADGAPARAILIDTD
jgi:arylformamidase